MEDLIRTLPPSQKRQARLSLTEFLSDPRNFQEDGEQKQEQIQQIVAEAGASNDSASVTEGRSECLPTLFIQFSQSETQRFKIHTFYIACNLKNFFNWLTVKLCHLL